MKVLITGGAGFVGRHFCKYFLDQGDEVWCVDPLVKLTGGLHPLKWPLFKPFDFKNFVWVAEDCRKYFSALRIDSYDLAIHLAAIVGGREMIEHQPLAVADDLSIDAAFWQWCVKAKPKKVICFSSSAVYPVALQRKEVYKTHGALQEHLINFDRYLGMPDMSYGWAKLTHEYLAKLAYEKHGIKSVVYRPFSGYGEDQDLAYPFPAICNRMIKQRNDQYFTVWGSGDQIRDFIHIDDVVRGVLTTIDKVDDASAVNLSTGVGTSFKQFANKASEILRSHPIIKGMSDKPEGVFARVGCTKKQSTLGFTASITLDEGIKRAFNYFDKNKMYADDYFKAERK